MGYAVIERRQFIKLTDEIYLPLAKYQTSNCTDLNGRKVRSVGLFSLGNNRYINASTYKEDIINVANSKIDYVKNDRGLTYEEAKKEVYDNLGWYITFYIGANRNASLSTITKWFERGMKEAISIEEFVSLGVFSVHIDSNKESVTTTERMLELIDKSFYITTYESMFDSICDKKFYLRRGEGFVLKRERDMVKYLIFQK